MPAAWGRCANTRSTTVSSRALVSSLQQPSRPKSAWPGDTWAKTSAALPDTAAGSWPRPPGNRGRRETAFQGHLRLLPHFS